MVGANTFRNPGLTAKLATTLDHLSGAARSSASAAPGSSASTTPSGSTSGSGFGGRLDRLDEAVDAPPPAARRRARSRTTARSTRCTTRSCAPRPVQARLPIMIGGSGPKKTLRTLARYGDQWNSIGHARGAPAQRRDPAGALRGRSAATRSRSSARPRRHRHPRHPPTPRLARYKARLAANGEESTPTGTSRRAAGSDRRGPRGRSSSSGFRHVLVDSPRRTTGDDRADRRGGRAAHADALTPGRRAGRRGRRARSSPRGSRRTSADRPDGRRQHRRRLRAPRAAGDARPRHRAVQPRRDRAGRVGLGHRGRHHATMAQLGGYGEETGSGSATGTSRCTSPGPRASRAGARLTDVCLGLQRSLGIAARDPADEPTTRSRPRSGPTTAGSSSRSTSSTGARSPRCTRCGSPASRRPGRRPRCWRRSTAAEAIVVAPVEPDRLGRPDPRGARHARRRSRRRARGASAVAAVSPIIGGRALKGPADRMLAVARPRGVGARRRAAVRRARRRVRARHRGRGARARRSRRSASAPVVTDTIMPDDASRARLAGIVLEAVGH